MKKNVQTSATNSVSYELYILVIECEGRVTVVYETKIFFLDYYIVRDELNEEITFDSESVFAFYGRYSAIRTWKLRIILLSETLDYTFHRKYTITRSWECWILNNTSS